MQDQFIGKDKVVSFTYSIRDESGEVVELRCSYDPETRSGTGTSDRKVKGTIHWVSAEHAIDATVNLYDRLFTHPNPAGEDNFIEHMNPDSLQTLTECKLEPSLQEANASQHYQFERTGYFILDKYSKPGEHVFNRTVNLRDTWAKIYKHNA